MSARKTICNLNFSPIRLCSLPPTTEATKKWCDEESWFDGPHFQQEGINRRLSKQCFSQTIPLSIWMNECLYTYPVPLADAAGVFQVSGPGQTEGAALKVPVREHVGQAKGVIILFCKKRTTKHKRDERWKLRLGRRNGQKLIFIITLLNVVRLDSLYVNAWWVRRRTHFSAELSFWGAQGIEKGEGRKLVSSSKKNFFVSFSNISLFFIIIPEGFLFITLDLNFSCQGGRRRIKEEKCKKGSTAFFRNR